MYVHEYDGMYYVIHIADMKRGLRKKVKMSYKRLK
jgi:hypothetical protein